MQTARAPMNVLVAGHITHDRYGDELLPGGSAFYAAHAYRALGAKVRIATRVGDDFSCESALAGFAALVARHGRTTCFVNSYAENGARTQRIEAIAPPIDVPNDWPACDLLHLAPVMGEIDLHSWLSRRPARLVGIGVQGWVRRAGPDEKVSQPRWEADRRELSGADVACIGEDDLFGQGDLLDRLVDAIPIVAFTHGKNGCEVIMRGKTTKVGAFATNEVDPTGAGDVFAAAFLFGLASGADPLSAARLGAGAASIVVEGRGGATLHRLSDAPLRARLVSVC